MNINKSFLSSNIKTTLFAVKLKQSIVSCFQSIVCLKILTNSVLLVECVLNDFQTEYALVLNALTNL